MYKEYIKNDHPEVLFYLRQNLVSKIPFYVSECKNDCFVRFREKVGDSLCLESHTGLR